MGRGDNGVARGNIQQAHAALSVEHTPESSQFSVFDDVGIDMLTAAIFIVQAIKHVIIIKCVCTEC